MFDGSHTLQTVFADGGDSVSPTAGLFDDGQTFAPLATGHYRLTLSAYSNDPNGPALVNGFTYDVAGRRRAGAGQRAADVGGFAGRVSHPAPPHVGKR